MSVTIWLTTILAGIIVYWFFKIKAKMNYWNDRGVKGPTGFTNVKNFFKSLNDIKPIGINLKVLYDEYQGEKMVGYTDLSKANLVVLDPSLLEQVLIKDFPSFSHHGFLADEDASPIEISLFTMAGSKWRALRNKITPTFTTGKLRGMTAQMVECYGNTAAFLDTKSDAEVDIKDLCGMFATDVVGSCVFGMDVRELAKPGSQFREMGYKLFRMTTRQMLKFIIVNIIPRLSKILKVTFNNPEAASYFENITLQTLEMRKKDKVARNDFLQLLLQLKEKGSIELHTKDLDADDEYLKTEETFTTETFEMTDKMVVSQAVSFLTAGFEAISLVMSYFCLEIALNPLIQEKVRTEIEEKLNKHGEMTYQALKDMVYLEQCLNETLRKYPVVNAIFREVTKATTLNGIELEEGTGVLIPVMAFHYDPAFYPEPDKFDPERFHPDAHRQRFTYLPFGDGPRVCIAMRFALLEMKVGLANLVRSFNISVSSKTKFPLEYEGRNFFLTPKKKIMLRLTKLVRN